MPKDIKRYPTLDGFRALAILLLVLVLVYYARAWPPLPGMGDWSVPADVAIVALFVLTGNDYYALADADPHRHIIGHLWSVAVGAQFLAVWPWLLLGALEGGWSVWLVRAGVAVIIGSMTLRSFARWFTEVPAIHPYNATESRVDALLIGSLLARCLRESRVAQWLTGLAVHPSAVWGARPA